MIGVGAVGRWAACAAVFFALAALVLGAMPTRAEAAKNCGTVEDFVVKREKGQVGCKQARGIASRFAQRSGSCGTSMRPACVVGSFHCRVATPGERGLAGYCYRLKKAVPAAQDFSFFKPRRFRVAITLSVSQRTSRLAGKSCAYQWVPREIKNRRNITCPRAKGVLARFAEKRGAAMPECRGNVAKRWNGWKLTASPEGGIIGTRFSKGRKAFTVIGGGAC